MHEHIQVSLLVERKAKGNLACCFHSFLQIFETEENAPFQLEGNDRLKPSKLLKLIIASMLSYSGRSIC